MSFPFAQESSTGEAFYTSDSDLLAGRRVHSNHQDILEGSSHTQSTISSRQGPYGFDDIVPSNFNTGASLCMHNANIYSPHCTTPNESLRGWNDGTLVSEWAQDDFFAPLGANASTLQTQRAEYPAQYFSQTGIGYPQAKLQGQVVGNDFVPEMDNIGYNNSPAPISTRGSSGQGPGRKAMQDFFVTGRTAGLEFLDLRGKRRFNVICERSTYLEAVSSVPTVRRTTVTEVRLSVTVPKSTVIAQECIYLE
ncbi:hypothetical protein CYLTODRAFT_463791 [Cylindrobasidium torrendii FP15055 ss-10]|uniref:Uncharacterized protein n=1 Tax=Cylindrobasidium torrendii FP15055 ss-10 TaxID=1314674 RepID=A0A0D7BS63_9AGAR|nr:hypothetical protein CYLTODRAFT_463791 [Cylindrobasidium torrendii FP15055 ss-10]